MEEKNKKKAPTPYCDTECKYYKIIDAPDFTAPNGIGKMELCSHGGGDRSFGCLNSCPKRYGE